MSETPRVGIVGTGRMGANIAQRLKDVGYAIAALYDARPEAAAQTAELVGGEATPSLARVTALSDVVVTVVSDDAAMYAIFSKDGDSLLQGADGKIFVNCATLTPKVHVEVQTRAEAHGARSLEACMASSIPQARNGIAVSDGRRARRGLQPRQTASREDERVAQIRRGSREGRRRSRRS